MSEHKFAIPGLPASKIQAHFKDDETQNVPAKDGKSEHNGTFAVPTLPASKIPKDGSDQPSHEDDQEDTDSKFRSARPEAPPLNYETPEWSAAPKEERYFEVLIRKRGRGLGVIEREFTYLLGIFQVLKSGRILETTQPITKDFIVVGRLPSCDIALEHAVWLCFDPSGRVYSSLC